MNKGIPIHRQEPETWPNGKRGSTVGAAMGAAIPDLIGNPASFRRQRGPTARMRLLTYRLLGYLPIEFIFGDVTVIVFNYC